MGSNTIAVLQDKEAVMRLIDADKTIMALRLEYPMMPMFKELREEWDLKTEGYRKAEKVVLETPTIKTKQIKYFDEDEKAWKIGAVIIDSEEG